MTICYFFLITLAVQFQSLQEPAFPPSTQQMKRDSIIGNYLMGENNNDERFPK